MFSPPCPIFSQLATTHAKYIFLDSRFLILLPPHSINDYHYYQGPLVNILNLLWRVLL